MKGSQPLFSIDSHMGLISTIVNNALDREAQDEYKIIVQAKDRGTPPMSCKYRGSLYRPRIGELTLFHVSSLCRIIVQVKDRGTPPISYKYAGSLYRSRIGELHLCHISIHDHCTMYRSSIRELHLCHIQAKDTGSLYRPTTGEQNIVHAGQEQGSKTLCRPRSMEINKTVT